MTGTNPIHTPATSSVADSTADIVMNDVSNSNLPSDELPFHLEDLTNIPSPPLLSKKDIEFIQASIQMTTRPSSHQGPPSNLGEAQHGKLKADQWRSAMEFDIPVALAKLWTQDQKASPELKQRRMEILELTVHLSCAIFWATSRRTSPRHVERYNFHMKSYLLGLRRLFPEHNLHPLNHLAMHLGLFIRLFGPVHGWWTYPFERLIGLLQKVQTNGKLGTCFVHLTSFLPSKPILSRRARRNYARVLLLLG